MNTFEIAGFHPLPASRKQAYDFYKPVALDDGFPARVTSQGAVAHPIYGAYMLRDYLWMHQRTKDPEVLAAAAKIGNAAIERMETFGEAKVFWYAEDELAPSRGQHYSGLTQARYLMPLFDLSKRSGDERFRRAAAMVFESLRLPVESGGVACRYGDGVVIEEFPHFVPVFILNGWTTALMQIDMYARASGDPEAEEFLRLNFTALTQLLPLFDVEHLANTRYQLAGFIDQRLVVPEGSEISVVSGGVSIGPTVHKFSERKEVKAPNWESYVVGSPQGGSVEFRTLVSRAIFPAENEVHLEVHSSSDVTARHELGYADYSPLSANMARSRITEWRAVQEVKLVEGINHVRLPLRWANIPLLGYPTNFKKKVGGVNRNVYHWMHVTNLEALSRPEYPEISNWASRWRSYTERWPAMDVYREHGVNLEQHSALNIEVPVVPSPVSEVSAQRSFISRLAFIRKALVGR